MPFHQSSATRWFSPGRKPAAAALYAVYPTALESDPRAQQFVDFLAANIVPALALPVPVRAPAAHPRAHDSAAH